MATTDETNDVFLANRETQEIQDKDLTVEERQEVRKANTVEWEKLLKTGAIKMCVGG